jgi:hypothetical protein
MEVNAVVTKVGLTALEPREVRILPIEDLLPGLEPVELLTHLSPESFRIIKSSLQDFLERGWILDSLGLLHVNPP